MLWAERSVRTVMGIIQSGTDAPWFRSALPRLQGIHTEGRCGPFLINQASSTITAAIPVSTMKGT
ncbi:hypothetical protein SAMN05216288_0179 [Pseudomonas punonensis]|uniref:Uncharacterized protein n=1 Tax=Phytopseudomonas punonensis TaxID=1220495 RepID=A0A1M7N5F7_9GAMM|nr:hypothetical protein SAMN05216288_0179 [Pseudomonas punonensis]